MTTDPMSDIAARLQLARKAARLNQEDVAQRLGVARTTITAIEKGERRVQAAELVQLAGLYGKSVNEFLRAGQPTRPLAVQLRASLSKDSADVEKLEPIFAQFQALAEEYVQLEELCKAPLPRRYPAERKLGGVSAETLAEDVASQERERLGLGDGPVHRLRDVLEREVGLRIFCMELPSNVSGMFIYDEVIGGCIAANSKHPVVRVRQTISHEYAHFLTSRQQPTIEADNQYRRLPESERFASAFSPSFLMPLMGLRRRVNQIKAANDGSLTAADLLSLADYYAVSPDAMIRRLEDLKLVSRGTWERITLKPARVSEARKLYQSDAQRETREQFPMRYTLLAIDAFENGLVTEAQFARFLRVDILEARRIHQDHADRHQTV